MMLTVCEIWKAFQSSHCDVVCIILDSISVQKYPNGLLRKFATKLLAYPLKFTSLLLNLCQQLGCDFLFIHFQIPASRLNVVVFK